MALYKFIYLLIYLLKGIWITPGKLIKLTVDAKWCNLRLFKDTDNLSLYRPNSKRSSLIWKFYVNMGWLGPWLPSVVAHAFKCVSRSISFPKCLCSIIVLAIKTAYTRIEEINW